MDTRASPLLASRRGAPNTSLLLAAGILGASCVGAESLELPVEPGDLVILATADDPAHWCQKAPGDRQVTDAPAVADVTSFLASAPRSARSLAADPSKPLFLFRIKSAELVGATHPITLADLTGVRARLSNAPSAEACATSCGKETSACKASCSAASDPSACLAACDAAAAACLGTCRAARTGDCARCLVPATTPPMIVNDGDRCRLAPFIEGHIYCAEDGQWVTRADDAEAQALDAARLAIRLEWPGACPCGDTADAPTLAGLEIRPITPEGAPWPTSAVASTEDGLVAAVSDRVAFAFDPRAPTPVPPPLELEDYVGEVRAAVGLPGGDLLVVGRKFNEGLTDGYRFDVLGRAGAGFSALSPLGLDLPARPQTMKFLGERLYLLGGATASFGAVEPALFSCETDPLRCDRAPLDGCNGDQLSLLLEDGVILPDGTGYAISDRALFAKAAPRTGTTPSAADPWTCRVPSSAFEWAPAAGSGPPVTIQKFRSMAAIGDRVFLCATIAPGRCEPSYPVVLTATVGAAPGEEPRPLFRVIAREADGADCKAFLPVDGDPTRVRAMFSSGHTLELDADGHPGLVGQIGELFGPVSLPWSDIHALASGDLVALTRENGLYVSRDGAPFVELYGERAPEWAAYRRIVAADDGTFYAFGRPAGIVRVGVEHTGAAGFPVVHTSLVEDPGNTLRASDHVRGAVVDHAASKGGSLVLLVSGYSDGSPVVPLLRRLELEARTSTLAVITGAADVDVPAALAGLSIDGLTEVGVTEGNQGRFVGIVQDTRIIQIDGDRATEIPVDFDDPATPTVEARPTLPPRACGGGVPRLDAWRAIDGKNGVAWAVGQYGLIVRIAGAHAERFVPTVMGSSGTPRPVLDPDLGSVQVSCPDRVLVAGSYDPDGAGARLDAWRVGPEDAGDGSCTPASTGADERLVVREIPKTECLGIPATVDQIEWGVPQALLVDGASSGVALDDGYVHRFRAGDRVERIKIPFSILTAAQNGRGDVLFGGWESRLAVGVPAGR